MHTHVKGGVHLGSKHFFGSKLMRYLSHVCVHLGSKSAAGDEDDDDGLEFLPLPPTKQRT